MDCENKCNYNYTKKEIEEIVKLIRLNLYNRGACCGAEVIKNKMGEGEYHTCAVEKNNWANIITPWFNSWQDRVLLKTCIM